MKCTGLIARCKSDRVTVHGLYNGRERLVAIQAEDGSMRKMWPDQDAFSIACLHIIKRLPDDGATLVRPWN